MTLPEMSTIHPVNVVPDFKTVTTASLSSDRLDE